MREKDLVRKRFYHLSHAFCCRVVSYFYWEVWPSERAIVSAYFLYRYTFVYRRLSSEPDRDGKINKISILIRVSVFYWCTHALAGYVSGSESVSVFVWSYIDSSMYLCR